VVISDEKTWAGTAKLLSYANYYPFGMEMPGGSWSLGAYRYGFNGKEKDKETNSQDYGFRMSDPRIGGRFWSVDPLTKQYPELTPYQFASNTPIQAIDLDGLEAFFIHGTNHGPEVWDTELLRLTQVEIKKLTNNKTVDNNFSWKVPSKKTVSYYHDMSGIPYKAPRSNQLNGQLNDETDRKEAAGMLVDYIIEYRRINKIIDEEITLIGFSHGGNVATPAAEMLYKRTGLKVNIITLNTPAFNRESDPENPLNKPYIHDIITFWTPKDRVAGVQVAIIIKKQIIIK
jgi:RHS repeat-associated protein